MSQTSNERATEADVERGIQSDAEKDEQPNAPVGEKPKDPNLVTWNGPEDSENPKNWTRGKKWTTTLLVSGFTFVSPVSSSMIAPALPNVARSFSITSDAETSLALSIFVLAYALGPLLLGPASEVFGRARTLQAAATFYFVWNLACGFAQSEGQIIAFRFLSGIGASAPLAVGGGVLADCWLPHERGAAMAIYGLAPLLGPCLAPIAGAFIAQYTTWRWVFWSTCIADAIVQLLGAIWLSETYAPTILQRRAKRLRNETGNSSLHTDFDTEKTLLKVLSSAIVRPFRMLFTQPIVMLIAVYMGYIFGTMYILLTTFPAVYEGIYHESTGIAGLNYISIGVGTMIGGQLSARVSDVIYKRLAKRNGPGRPEYRVPLMFIGALLLPIGLFWYGFSAQAKLHWIMPNIGAAILSAAVIFGLLCMQTYTIDTYTRYAASAIAAATVLRSLGGFAFPLFAPAMYKSLGYGWGNGLLGFLGIGIGLPGPFVFWFYGEKLRAKSTFASG